MDENFENVTLMIKSDKQIVFIFAKKKKNILNCINDMNSMQK